MNVTRRILFASALCLAWPALAQQQAPEPPAAPAADVELREREARLRAAEARLQEAAREVARLSRGLAPMTLEMSSDALADSTRPRLGVSLGVIETGDADRVGDGEGLEVLGVSPGSAAEDAGIRAGDVLVGFGGESLRGRPMAEAIETIASGLEGAEVGDRFTLRIVRDGAEQAVDVTLTDASFAPGSIALLSGPGDREMRIIERERLGRLAEQEIELLRELEDERRVVRMGPRGAGGFAFIVSDSPWASMELVELTPRLGEYFRTDSGLLVVRAPEDAALGFEDGDVIREIGGRVPENVGHAMRILRSYEGGERLEIDIVRDGRRRTLQIDVPETVGRLPAVPSPPAAVAPTAPVPAPPARRARPATS